MQTWERPAPSAKGKPGAGVSFSADTGEYSHPHRRPQPASRAGIIFAIVAALRELPEEDHAGLLTWVAERGLIGIAKRHGPRAAAEIAYGLADTLAGLRHA